jgi:tRNA (guanine6-N2)-methyltransferase
MKNRYFSTTIYGLENIIEELLKKDLQNVEIILKEIGLIVYETTSNSDEIKNLPYLNNSFCLINLFNNLGSYKTEYQLKWAVSSPKFVEQMKMLANLVINGQPQEVKNTFRLFISKRNKTQIFPEKFENLIVKRVEQVGFSLQKSGADFEMWFMEIREGLGICGLRFTKHSDYHSTLNKSELRPEISYVMNYLSGPADTDVVLDPFSGSGSTMISRIEHFPYKKIILNDIDLSKIKVESFEKNKNIEILNKNFYDLEFENNSIDKIVTDPPWGIADTSIDVERLYENMLAKFSFWLVDSGTAVILISKNNKNIFKSLVSKYHFDISNVLELNIWGREVILIKIKKH